MHVPKEEVRKREPMVVIDGGAYDGDTSLAFANKLNVEKVYAFEPSKNNYDKMLKRIGNCDKIIPIKKGLLNKKTTIKFKEDFAYGGMGNRIDDEGNCYVETTTIDDFVKEYGLKKVDVIKLDVEGCEYEVIEGAKETIRKYKPILLISIYHREKDFFEIKPMIENLRKGYTFKIRRLLKGALVPVLFETMLIAY